MRRSLCSHSSIFEYLRVSTESTPTMPQCIAGEDLDMSQSAGVSREQLEQLKRESVTCINEALFKRLQDIEQVRLCFSLVGYNRLPTVHTFIMGRSV